MTSLKEQQKEQQRRRIIEHLKRACYVNISLARFHKQKAVSQDALRRYRAALADLVCWARAYEEWHFIYIRAHSRKLKKQALEGMARCARTFEEWSTVYFWAGGYRSLRRKALRGMLRTAQTFNHWRGLTAYVRSKADRERVRREMEERARTRIQWDHVARFSIKGSSRHRRALEKLDKLAA